MPAWNVDQAPGSCTHPVLGTVPWRPVRLTHPDHPGIVYVVDDRAAGERHQQGRWELRFCRTIDALDTLAGLRPAPDALPPPDEEDEPATDGASQKLWKLRRELDPKGELVGAGRAMLDVLAELAVAADGGAAVLLHGPTGTGKTTLAELAHRRWNRSGPFVRVSAAASGGDPVAERGEWVGYGHKHGFQGVPTRQAGHLTTAKGGTLFVDDADALSITLQALLLDVVEGRPVHCVGGDSLDLDVRVIFATGMDLDHLRRDLVARLGGRVRVPPFKDRPHDPLAFATAFAGAQEVRLDPRAHLAIARQPDWPENARGVQAVVQAGAARAALDGRKTVLVGDLPRRIDRDVCAQVAALTSDEARAKLWARADAAAREEGFQAGSGLQSRAAAILGQSRASASAAYRSWLSGLP